MILEKFTLLLIVVIFGWQHHAVAQQTPAQSNIPQDTTIKVRRLPNAFGNGADYELEVTADGALVIKTFKDFKVASTTKSNITPEQMNKLITEFEKVNFFSLRETYLEAKDECPVVVTDQAHIIIYFKMNGRGKTVSHYYGCLEGVVGAIYPRELTALETKIDEIIRTDQWLK